MPDVKDARIAFADMLWEDPMVGQRVKRFQRDGRTIRLVEFSDQFVEPGWCEKGHSGIVLEGTLALEFPDGREERLSKGDGLYVPATQEGKHKAKVASGRALVLLVDG